MLRNLPAHRCPVCGKRVFLTESVPDGRRYSCVKGHRASVGRAVPAVKLKLGKKVTRRDRARLWMKRKVRRAKPGS